MSTNNENTEQIINSIFLSLDKQLHFIKLKKYNHIMTPEEVLNMEVVINKILQYKEAYFKSTNSDKELLQKTLLPFKKFTLRDFAEYKIENFSK